MAFVVFGAKQTYEISHVYVGAGGHAMGELRSCEYLRVFGETRDEVVFNAAVAYAALTLYAHEEGKQEWIDAFKNATILAEERTRSGEKIPSDFLVKVPNAMQGHYVRFHR